MRPSDATHRRAHSLIETLVVLGIISIMVSLMVPALFQARQAALEKVCENNIRQIHLAVRQFESYSRYEPFTNTTNLPGGWVVDLLPFIEQQPLAQSLNPRIALDAPTNLQLCKHLPQVFRCPFQNDRASTVAEVPAASYIAVVHEFAPGDPSRPYRRRAGKVSRIIEIQDAPADFDRPWILSPEVLFAEAQAMREQRLGPHPGGVFRP